MISRFDILARLDEMGGHLYELRRLVGESLVDETGEEVVAAAGLAMAGDEGDKPGDAGAGPGPAPVLVAEDSGTQMRHRRG